MSKEQVTLRTIIEKTQGLITIKPKLKVVDSYTLSLVYTPGVGQCCLDIKAQPNHLYELTNVSNSLAVITDGSNQNILHTNELIPKLEAQAALFKFFYNIDVFPFILDPKICLTAEDILLAIENLAPTYKVIDLKHISEERMTQVLKLLEGKNLGITVLYKDLWKNIHVKDAKGQIPVKEYLDSLIIEAATVRAILDQRAIIPVGEGPLTSLVDYTLQNGLKFLANMPNNITDLLIQTYVSALTFIADQKLQHQTVKHVPLQFYIQRMINFYFYGKKSFINSWGQTINKQFSSSQNHNLGQNSMNDNSISLHRRYTGMIAISPKFKPRSLEEVYNIFKRSFESDDIQILQDKIRQNPSYAEKATFKSNLMAIMTNGTAILGLGDIGSSAGLPVMEGKSVLFKSLAGIDVVPVCIKEKDAVKAARIFKMLSPIFNGINLEDIKAPECFDIEHNMIESLDIPVMHDDQHGTAVVCSAAILNGLKLMKKQADQVKLVINGAGAAGLAICELLLKIGIKNVIICDTIGALYEGRPTHMNEFKNKLAAITNRQKESGTLDQIIKGADLFIGVSVAGALTADHVKSMNPKPFILALANPVPEIMPDIAKSAGAFIVATGRSDFKNQVNNSLVFPGIFRGAIDVKARRINTEMKLAAAHAIANLVKDSDLNPDHIMPQALDMDIPSAVAFAVAEAAIKTGVAQKQNITPEYVKDFTRKLNIEGMVPKI